MVGSAQLAQTLMANRLVDQYRLLVHPIVVGAGKKLSRDHAATTPMQLVDLRTSPGGLVLLTYQPATEATPAA